jgi:Uncharacterized protein conserved in bacteria (DUF2188)
VNFPLSPLSEHYIGPAKAQGAQRASGRFDTKEEAVKRGRELADARRPTGNPQAGRHDPKGAHLPQGPVPPAGIGREMVPM